MRRAQVDAVIHGVAPEVVFDRIIQFGRYPDFAPHVSSTTVHQTVPARVGRSSWVLHFRSGLLRWTESERFSVEELRIDFDQDHGDFDAFTGHWQLTPREECVELHFEVDFDFGIPSLEGILDPIAERVIKETVAWTMVGMFDAVHLVGESEQPGTTVERAKR